MENFDEKLYSKFYFSLESLVDVLIKRLQDLQSQKNSCVIIVVSGYPDSGKTFLIKKTITKLADSSSKISYLIGAEKIDILGKEHFLSGNFLFIEDIGDRVAIDSRIKKSCTDCVSDIFVYVYNPLHVWDYPNHLRAYASDADFVLNNNSERKLSEKR